MAKNYRNKDACIQEAERLGINVSGMSWPQLQKVVSEALRLEELGVSPKSVLDNIPEDITNMSIPNSKFFNNEKPEDPLAPYMDKTIIMSPELAPERYRLVKYDEILGNEIEVEERSFDIDRNTDQVYDMSGGEVNHDTKIDEYHDYTTGTYRIKARKDRVVTGMASVPKENPMLSFRPGIDMATVVSFNGKHGYLWKHWRYPNVSALLRQAGDEYYEKYRKVFKDQPNVFYLCGHLVCNPYLVHRVLKEIEEDAKRKAIEQKAYEKQLGMGTW